VATSTRSPAIGHHPFRLGTPGQRGTDPDRQVQRGGAGTDGWPAAEQPGRLVVAHRDPAGGVGGDHPLADAVQHRLAFLHQFGQLARFQPERLALQPPGQQGGAGDAEQQRAAREQRRVGEHPQPVGPYVVGREPHADLADDPVVGRIHRHLAAGRPAERAALHVHHVVPGQRLGRIGRHVPPDLGRVRVREPDPAGVGDHDGQRVGGLPYPFGVGTDDRHVTGRDRVGDVRVGGDRVCHRERAPLVLVGELAVHQPADEREADADHQQDDADLEQQDLPGEPDAREPPHQPRARNARNGINAD
jgi:hypothetical protein